jgi:hypothetical protein
MLLGLDSSTIPPTALLIAGVVFITAFLLLRVRKRKMRGPGHITAREQLEQLKQRDGVRSDLESLMVEIEQMAKRLGSQLDAKAMHLEKLIDDADLRLAQLKQADDFKHQLPPAAPGSEVPATDKNDFSAASNLPIGQGPDPGGSLDPLAAEVHRLADEGLAPPAIAMRLSEHVGKVELILALRESV